MIRKGSFTRMEEKDFKLDDIINKAKDADSEKKEADQESAIEKLSEDIASAVSENKLNNEDGHPVDDFSLEPEKEEEKAPAPAIPLEKPEPESDSDIIIPESENVEKTQTAKNLKAVRRASVAQSRETEDDIHIIRSDRPASAKKKKKKKKAKGTKVNNSVFGGLIIISLILTVSIVLAYGGIKLGMEYLGIGKNQNEITFNIPEGATSEQVVELLEKNGIITEPKLFSIIMKMQDKPFYPGDITLKPATSYTGIISALAENRGVRETVTITFPEGITLLEAAKMIEANKVCDKKDFLFQFNKKQDFPFESLIEETDQTFYKMEGYFYPDTYEFYVNDDAYNVTKIIRQHFQDKFTSQMQSKMQQNGLTLNELITLASMVQREAGTVKDMPIVASVFLNRLDNQDLFPSLESDATSNYIDQVIKVAADTNVSIKHFTESYDTYKCKGLPAGPICNPGLDAINAVLNPEKTEYFFFCNNLDTGKAYYAKTNEEHEKNLVKAGLVDITED